MSQFFRRQSPPQYNEYQKYRPFLRLDFRQLCAYCERSEFVLGGEELFEIDHFRPTNRFPELTAHYANLYYACGKCNRHKGSTWPSESQLGKGLRFADPCEEDMYLVHLREMSDGRLEVLSVCGEYTRMHLLLDRPALVSWRRLRRQIADELRTFNSIKERLASLLATETDVAKQREIRNEILTIELAISRSQEGFSLVDPKDSSPS